MKRILAYLALLSICAPFGQRAFSQTPATEVAAASPAPAGGSFQELLNRLDDEIASALGSKPAGGRGGDRSEIALAAQLQHSLGRGEYDAARNTLAKLLDAMPTPAGKQIVRQLQAAFPGYIEEHKNALAERVAALRDKAARVCLESTKETDLDPLCDEIDALRIASSSSLDARELAKLDAARQFLGQWQKYLTEYSAGYDDEALAALRSSVEKPTAYPLLPYSKITAQIDALAQFGPAERAAKILSGLKTLDDLPRAIDALGAIGRYRPLPSQLSALIKELARLEEGNAALKAGDYAAALSAVTGPLDFKDARLDDVGAQRWIAPWEVASGSGGTEIGPVFFRLRQQLLTAILPAYLALPENPPPKPGEDPSRYLLRLAQEAAARADYGQVSQILSAYKVCAFNGGAPSWLDAGIAACSDYFKGQELEQGGSFAAAVVAYHRVLERAPGCFNPTAEAVARLAALRKDHPADFDRAVAGLLPPASTAPVGGG